MFNGQAFYQKPMTSQLSRIKIWWSPMNRLGSPMKILGTPMKILGLQWRVWGLRLISWVPNENLGDSNENLGDSIKNLRPPMKSLGSPMKNSVFNENWEICSPKKDLIKVFFIITFFWEEINIYLNLQLHDPVKVWTTCLTWLSFRQNLISWFCFNIVIRGVNKDSV